MKLLNNADLKLFSDSLSQQALIIYHNAKPNKNKERYMIISVY